MVDFGMKVNNLPASDTSGENGIRPVIIIDLRYNCIR
jgi:hypothetical protein